MPAKTKIEYADYTSNPLKATPLSPNTTSPQMSTSGGRKKVGWACVKVSPGCAHCWASKFNVRLGTGLEYSAQNMKKVEVFLDEKELKRIAKFAPKGPFKWGRERAVVFPVDMTDLFGDWVSDEWIDRIFQAMWMNQNVDWFVLTKRADRMAQYCQYKNANHKQALNNIYLGCSIEDDQHADERIYPMRNIHTLGWKTWVSYEPALSRVDWKGWEFLNQLICGGESGSRARAMHPDWARSARDFCTANNIPFFFKQWGEFIPLDHLAWVTDKTTFKHQPTEMDGVVMCRVGKAMAGRTLDGLEYNGMPKE